jgi:hypothetical protein
MTTTTPTSTPPSVIHLPAVGLGFSRLPDNSAPRSRDTCIEFFLVAMRTLSMPAVGLGCGSGDITPGTFSASESGHLL